MRVIYFSDLTAGVKQKGEIVAKVNENWEWSGVASRIEGIKHTIENVNRRNDRYPEADIHKYGHTGKIEFDDLPKLFWGSYFWASLPLEEESIESKECEKMMNDYAAVQNIEDEAEEREKRRKESSKKSLEKG